MQENSKSEHDAARKPAPLRGEIGHVCRPDAYIGTERSTSFARQMTAEGFPRFEEVLEDSRERFNDRWLRS
jgi:hypothetical protein